MIINELWDVLFWRDKKECFKKFKEISDLYTNDYAGNVNLSLLEHKLYEPKNSHHRILYIFQKNN